MRLVCIGNPIRAEGRFVDLIRQADRERADKVPPRLAVNAIRIPSTESPHAHREKSPFGLADKTRIGSMHRKYGKDGVGGPPTFRHPENVCGPKCREWTFQRSHRWVLIALLALPFVWWYDPWNFSACLAAGFSALTASRHDRSRETRRTIGQGRLPDRTRRLGRRRTSRFWS